jgi:hypothetical protein
LFTAYVVVALMAVAASTFVAVANFMRLEFVLTTAAKVRAPQSWITMLGTLNAAAAFGLLLGLIGVPLIGTAAAVGLVMYVVGAIVAFVTTRSARRLRFSCWPWPRWCWDWSREASRVRWRLRFSRRTESLAGPPGIRRRRGTPRRRGEGPLANRWV